MPVLMVVILCLKQFQVNVVNVILERFVDFMMPGDSDVQPFNSEMVYQNLLAMRSLCMKFELSVSFCS